MTADEGSAAELRWRLQTPDATVCAMLAAGPLPQDAVVRLWRDAAVWPEADEPHPSEDQVRASLERLTVAGYLAQIGGECALTESGMKLADQVATLQRALRANDSSRGEGNP